MLEKIGIFFGSDTGNTEKVALMLQERLGIDRTEVHDIAQATPKDYDRYPILLLGLSTWHYGEAQCDWEAFFPELPLIDFSQKQVALFGCGDQEDYAEHFCNAMGQLHSILLSLNAKVIGYWTDPHYRFLKSKAELSPGVMVGLAIDEDRQPALTQMRVEQWVQQLQAEFKRASLGAQGSGYVGATDRQSLDAPRMVKNATGESTDLCKLK